MKEFIAHLKSNKELTVAGLFVLIILVASLLKKEQPDLLSLLQKDEQKTTECEILNFRPFKGGISLNITCPEFNNHHNNNLMLQYYQSIDEKSDLSVDYFNLEKKVLVTFGSQSDCLYQVEGVGLKYSYPLARNFKANKSVAWFDCIHFKQDSAK